MEAPTERRRDLFKEFGEWRVIDTPISEATIGGAAVGAAMAGTEPHCRGHVRGLYALHHGSGCQSGRSEWLYVRWQDQCADGDPHRGRGRAAIAAHHSQSLESLWTPFPGIYVVMPSTAYDAKGLLKAAIRDDNPVMFIEHKMLYKEKGFVPEEEYIIPFGVANIKRAGKDVDAGHLFPSSA